MNKNAHVPFCAIGADHALEQINRSMKVSGGLADITLKPSARNKFFLISPELARLTTEAEQMAGVKFEIRSRHHGLLVPVLDRYERNICSLTTTFSNFSNPFEEELSDLFNLVTKSVVPEQVKEDLCKQADIGSKLFETFVAECIKNEDINLWAPSKKQKLATWKTAGKKVRITAGDQVVELREDRSLFARLLEVCKSRPEIDLRDSIG